MFPIKLVACLLFVTDWAESKGVVPPPGGGVSKQHRQQDDYGNYNFGYDIQDPTSHQFRRESGDVYGRVVGSYGLSEADGRQRIVDYIADEYGFRAKIRTNEPGTGAENSAAVEVVKPGHPPSPPRIPALSSPPPQPPPPPPPPPPRHASDIPSSIKSTFTSQTPISDQEPLAYIQHPPPYGHPYYYTPIKSSFGNTLYSLPQTKQSLYIPSSQSQDDYSRYDQYKLPINIQPYYPVPPPSVRVPQKYVSSVHNPAIATAQTDLNFPSDTTQNKNDYSGVKLPANYKVIQIPNGIQAVPISGKSTTDERVDQPPYQYRISNFPRVAYPSGRDPVYLGFKSARKSYVDSPRDYAFAGSDETKSVTIPEKESSQK